MSRDSQKCHESPGPSVLLCIVLIAAALSILFLPGCNMNSRDSGSTVTGRALSLPAGNGVPFIRVLVNGDNALRLQVTDSNGLFTMYHVPKGTYKARFARFGLELYSEDLVIEEDDQSYIVNMPEVSAGVNDLIGIIENTEGPIEDAEIWMIYPNGGLVHTQSNEDGEYALSELPDGETTVVVEADDHLMKIVEEVRVGFEGVSELDVELEVIPDFDGGTVLGKVLTSEGEYLEDAYVGVFPDMTVPSIFMVAQAETLSTGDGFILPDIPPGTYEVICTKSGYALQSETVVVVEFGEHVVDFVLDSEEEIWRDTNRILDSRLSDES